MPIILEKELEDYLYHFKSDKEEHPLGVEGKVYRQFKIEGYGVIDLLYVDISPNIPTPSITVTIVELKKDNIDLSALGQISRYKIALERFFDELQDVEYRKYFKNLEIRGILVGSGYANGDICYVVDSIEWVECYHYDLCMADGVTFEWSDGWLNKGECFDALYEHIDTFKDEYIQFYKEGRRCDRSSSRPKRSK